MKRLTKTIMALAILGLVTMVSCRKPVIENYVSGGRTVTFNARTEGDGSKTYLNGIKVLWKAGDQININGTDDKHKVTLTSEEGSELGIFSSNQLTATAPFLASYPKTTTNDGTTVTFVIPNNQSSYTANLDDVIPMVAYTENNPPEGQNCDLDFKNMVNVLKLNLKGDGTYKSHITEIRVMSDNNAEYMNGTFSVDKDLVPVHSTGGIRTTYFVKDMQLTSEVQTVCIVLPVFTDQNHTVSVRFFGESGDEILESITLEGSNTRNHLYTADIDVDLKFVGTVTTIPACAIHKNCASSGGVVTNDIDTDKEQGVCWGTSPNPTVSGTHYVHQYEYSTGSLTPKGKAGDTFTGFMSGLAPGTTYYYRAYMKKGQNVIYGDELSFTTKTETEDPDYEYVELYSGYDSGTGQYTTLKWSNKNLGATNGETDDSWYGDYYQWGDCAACTGVTENKRVKCEGWQAYRFSEDDSYRFTRYSNNTTYWCKLAGNPVGTPDGKMVLNLDDDAARKTLGGDWRIPTSKEWENLLKYDSVVYVAKNATNTTTGFTAKANGYLVIKGKTKNGNLDTTKYVFFPLTGRRYNLTLQNVGVTGYYWSSSLRSDNPTKADYAQPKEAGYGFNVTSESDDHTDVDYRSRGCVIRPVKD